MSIPTPFPMVQKTTCCGLNAMEKFSKVIINLKDMYLEAITFTEKQ